MNEKTSTDLEEAKQALLKAIAECPSEGSKSLADAYASLVSAQWHEHQIDRPRNDY